MSMKLEEVVKTDTRCAKHTLRMDEIIQTNGICYKYPLRDTPKKIDYDRELRTISELRRVIAQYREHISQEESDKALLEEGKISDNVMKKLIEYCKDEGLNFYETFGFYTSAYHAGCMDVCNPIIHIKVIFGIHRSAKPYWNDKTFCVENPLSSIEYTALRIALALGYSTIALGLAIAAMKTLTDVKQIEEVNEIASSLENAKKLKHVTTLGESAKQGANLAAHNCIGDAKERYIDAALKASEAVAHMGASVLSREIPLVAGYEAYQGVKCVKEAFKVLGEANELRDWGMRAVQPMEHTLESYLQSDTFSNRDQ